MKDKFNENLREARLKKKLINAGSGGSNPH